MGYRVQTVLIGDWSVRFCISFFFFFHHTATTEIYTLSLHDALPISFSGASGAPHWLWANPERVGPCQLEGWVDRKSTRLNSSHLGISYAVFCLKKKRDIESVTLYVYHDPDLAQLDQVRDDE